MRPITIRNTGTRINPSSPFDSTESKGGYYCPEQTIYIIRKSNDGVIAATSYGRTCMADLEMIGQSVELMNDATCGHLDYNATIIGVVHNDADEATGEIPTKKVPHYVFK